MSGRQDPGPDAWSLFWRGFRLMWLIVLIAAATYAIVADHTAPPEPFPMQWDGPHWTSVVGPPVAGHGHRGHLRGQPRVTGTAHRSTPMPGDRP